MRTAFEVTPEVALVDEVISIRLTGLAPGETVDLRARMQDHLGQIWESCAVFRADGDGQVDLQRDAPQSGSYADVDPMGLFWSMKLQAKVETVRRSSLDSVPIELTAEVNGAVVAATVLQRLFVAPSVVQQPLAERGLVGTLFYPSDRGPHPTVLVVGGSDGGLKVRQAALLASHGFAALALAYFGMPDLPAQLVNIPLEYFAEAIDWLLEQPVVQKDRLAMMGTSKGGELALLCASMFPQIKAVVGYAPSSVVFGGLGQAPAGTLPSSWSYRGVPLPYASAEPPEDIRLQLEQWKRTGEPIRYRKWYWSRLGDRTILEKAVIPVEKINGDILLISGTDDQLWPSDRLSDLAIERLQQVKYPYRFAHLQYTGAGHSLGIPFLPTTEGIVANSPGLSIALGGGARENHEAQADAWPQVLAFLHTSLAKEK